MAGRTHCVVLMSGGIDSSATLVACRDLGTSLSGMFINYGKWHNQSRQVTEVSLSAVFTQCPLE